MGKRLPYTPNSQIRSALRQLFLRSRERLSALKRDGYRCTKCGAKQSRAKGREVYVQVHHVDAIDWGGLIDDIRQRLLAPPMITLCKSCHDKEHTG